MRALRRVYGCQIIDIKICIKKEKSANALGAVLADSAVLPLFLVSLFHLKLSVCVDLTDCMCVWRCEKESKMELCGYLNPNVNVHLLHFLLFLLL